MEGKRFLSRYLERATEDALSAYNDLRFIADRSGGREQYLKLLDASAPSIDGDRIQGTRMAWDEKVVRAIDRKDEELEAIRLVLWIDNALDYMSEHYRDEADALRAFFIDGEKDIRTIQRMYHVEKSQAYSRLKQAVVHCSRLLFW